MADSMMHWRRNARGRTKGPRCGGFLSNCILWMRRVRDAGFCRHGYQRGYGNHAGGAGPVHPADGKRAKCGGDNVGEMETKKPPQRRGFQAERVGFEPTGHSSQPHDFQSCSLSHSDISPINRAPNPASRALDPEHFSLRNTPAAVNFARQKENGNIRRARSRHYRPRPQPHLPPSTGGRGIVTTDRNPTHSLPRC
jgi:hypothetical protein